MSSALSSACDFKSYFAISVDPDQTAPLEQSDQGPHCLPVCKNRFENFVRIFSRRHKKTTFSDAGFLGNLRAKTYVLSYGTIFPTRRHLPPLADVDQPAHLIRVLCCPPDEALAPWLSTGSWERRGGSYVGNCGSGERAMQYFEIYPIQIPAFEKADPFIYPASILHKSTAGR